jgi:hypothetical protein
LGVVGNLGINLPNCDSCRSRKNGSLTLGNKFLPWVYFHPYLSGSITTYATSLTLCRLAFWESMPDFAGMSSSSLLSKPKLEFQGSCDCFMAFFSSLAFYLLLKNSILSIRMNRSSGVAFLIMLCLNNSPSDPKFGIWSLVFPPWSAF